MTKDNIIQELPYSKPFLFVDEIIAVNEHQIKGTYTFREDEYFYQGHFKNNPITPGVILTECMAQIGLASFGIFLIKNSLNQNQLSIAITSSEIDFYKPVLPGEKVSVIADKEYFRFNKLKCKVAMYNANDTLVAKGTIAGMAFQQKK
ncbi:3-hydroxyacyl-ACP dehydratase FabZ family protein [Aquimarina algicola]|uniref:Hydroxymyristoyl-ACP dehydratase n=1 Tax=Aquimarina algicola TaxID=2589995 RepID=A0A504JR75_9FLAO|nr:hydroxymyristoyl-ACP dehydratase [Aquimarina algicola]TPN88850.1 hydroxymyristoyl-ACP dehydratase [Aquimarina algicola]